MSDMKQVKVDNWGIYFLQRLKHFFNRTDYCDLTLQFQDNAQLKVHRLVLSACTEYFELLERTCEMYEDCLIMPDDLQADVVVPIINFMYTGQLEFKPDLLDKLYQTSQIMNMPVLSKLLLAQKQQSKSHKTMMYNESKRTFTKAFADEPRKMYKTPQKLVNASPEVIPPKKKPAVSVKIPAASKPTVLKMPITKPFEHPAVNAYSRPIAEPRKRPTQEVDPRPTRYEVPEELADNIYSDSFSNISYESKPLMIHPETTKRYGAKKTRFGIFSDTSISKYNNDNNTTIDVVECRKLTQKDSVFESEALTDPLMFDSEAHKPMKKDSSQLFDQILEPSDGSGPKITIENKDSSEAANIDHAKIISEVLKKYPHLVKGNKNIKLKILDTKPKIDKKAVEKKPIDKKPVAKKTNHAPMSYSDVRVKTEKVDEEYCTYESEVIDSKEAARLISLGAENVSGPWICLICGTPGRAIHFTTYHSFRRHLVDVHNEKIIPNICEFCGIKSNKRNHLLHHLLTKHGVPPPQSIKFPKCSTCNYVALSEAILMKHKNIHKQDKVLRCNVCFLGFQNGTTLLQHIQTTGHRIKYSSDKKTMLRCVYCLKEFIKENNLYSHLVTRHNDMAKRDGILECSENSDDEKSQKSEAAADNESVEEDAKEMKYDINQTIIEKPQKQRILNAGYEDVSPRKRASSTINNTFDDTDFMGEEIEVILPDNIRNEEVLSNVEFEQQSQSTENEEYAVSLQPQHIELNPIKSTNVQTPRSSMKSRSVNHEMQIVVSSAEELKTLMGANHSIIFDQEGHSSKTLAVLTTPQCSTISTGTQINMETENTNQVMILPEQYALNMTEAVSTNDPNIVVVYSDELDQSKQYIMDPNFTQGQLVTTDGIATHFVQTSAVITPNYTSVPSTIISQEMAVVEASNWVGIEQPAETHDVQMDTNESARITNDSSVIICNTPTNTLEEINHISIIEPQQEITNMEFGQSEKKYAGNDSAMLITNNETTVESMEVDINNEQSGDQECPIGSNENIEQNAPASNEEVIEAINPDPMQDNETTVQDINLCTQHETINTTEDAVVTENTEEIVQGENAPNENNEQLNGEIEQVPEESVKQIDNLTTEWSEDEDDKDKDAEEQIESNEVRDSQSTEIADAVVEESIENIQEEVNKPSHDSKVDDVNEEEIVKDDENDETEQQETEDPVIEETLNNVPAPESQENISSLLNDWNENESQGENGSMELEQDESGDPEEGVEAAETAETVVAADAGVEAEAVAEDAAESVDEAEEGQAAAEVAPPPHKPDNIRSLVSDWDEDDEDAKV